MVVSDPNEEETGKEAWFMPAGRWVGPVCIFSIASYLIVEVSVFGGRVKAKKNWL